MCETLDKLNDDAFPQVIRALYSEFGNLELKDVLRKLVMKETKTMKVETLAQLDNELMKIARDSKYTMKHHKISNNTTSTKSQTPYDNIIFPLFRLPVDIIKNTSLFLNETDIFSFEKCCRLFYKMINNSIYLEKSKNFKTFMIDKTRLNQMSQSTYSFYKYSQSRKLNMTRRWIDYDEIRNIQCEWEKARLIDKKFDHWLTNLFKSIESLSMDKYSTTVLFGQLPVETLFGTQSQLQSIKLVQGREYGEEHKFLADCVKQFQDEYLNIKKKYSCQGKQMRKLQYLEIEVDQSACGYIEGPQFLEPRHVSLSYATNPLENNNRYSNAKFQDF